MMTRHKETLAAMAVLSAIPLAAPTSARAAAETPPPLCVADGGGGYHLDREALAAQTLGTLNLGFTSLSIAGKEQVQREGVTGGFYTEVLRAILTDGPSDGKTPPKKYFGVNDASRGHVRGYFLDNAPKVNGAPFPNKVTWSSIYLTEPAANVACDAAQVAKPAAAPPGAPTALAAAVARIRVRGAPDSLVDDRDANAAAFKGDTAATFSVLRDGTAKTTTYKVVGALGVTLLPASAADPHADTLVAFANINYSDTKAFTGASKPPASNEYDIGLIGSHFFANPHPEGEEATGGIWISARPDYLWDDNDHSQLFTGNLLLTPRFGIQFDPSTRWELNSYHTFPGFSVEPVLAFKFNGGAYTRNGSNAAAARQSAVARGGVQFGINVTSDDPNPPITFNASYVYLANLEVGKDIGYFSTAITFSLDKHKYTGITLNYNNGNLESTGKRQEQTTIGLSLKY